LNSYGSPSGCRRRNVLADELVKVAHSIFKRRLVWAVVLDSLP
jgi:hypothetical protein